MQEALDVGGIAANAPLLCCCVGYLSWVYIKRDWNVCTSVRGVATFTDMQK